MRWRLDSRGRRALPAISVGTGSPAMTSTETLPPTPTSVSTSTRSSGGWSPVGGCSRSGIGRPRCCAAMNAQSSQVATDLFIDHEQVTSGMVTCAAQSRASTAWCRSRREVQQPAVPSLCKQQASKPSSLVRAAPATPIPSRPYVFMENGQPGGEHLRPCRRSGIAVLALRRTWPVDDGEPTGPYWELVFR